MKRKTWKTGLYVGLLLLTAVLPACSTGTGNRAGTGSTADTGNVRQEASAGEEPANREPAGEEGKDGKDGKPVTVVFSTFWPDDVYKEAKLKYEAAHPNITIELQDVESDDAHLESELEKYVTATNTAMLSGKGPDLIALDMLPAEKYVGQHLLTDLGGFLKTDPAFKAGGYFTNILENSRINGSLYGMPLAFFLNALVGNEGEIARTGVQIDDLNWTWESFADTVKQLAKKGSFQTGFASDPRGLLTQMVKENGAKFVDEENRKASFDTAAFTELMQQVKAMSDDGVIGSVRGPSYFKPQNINSPWDYLVSLKEYGEQSRLYAKPRAKDTAPGGYFYTYQTIGINEKSRVKQEAWDFLHFLMSEELQRSPEKAGFPINKQVYEKQVQQLLAQGTVKAYEEGPLHGQTFPVDAAGLNELEDYLTGAVHRSPFQSSKIEDMITEESEAFFSGQKSAEAVAKLIQNKVTTYLNE